MENTTIRPSAQVYVGISNQSINPHTYMINACNILGTTEEEIMGKCRRRGVVMRRAAIATRLMMIFPDMSLVKIGKLIGRDHATIIFYRDSFAPTGEYYESMNKLKVL